MLRNFLQDASYDGVAARHSLKRDIEYATTTYLLVSEVLLMIKERQYVAVTPSEERREKRSKCDTGGFPTQV